MPCQSQWPCHELGLYYGWFGREGVGLVSSVSNVVYESDEAIVKHKEPNIVKLHSEMQVNSSLITL